jgi:hypothetical protein
LCFVSSTEAAHSQGVGLSERETWQSGPEKNVQQGGPDFLLLSPGNMFLKFDLNSPSLMTTIGSSVREVTPQICSENWSGVS